MCSQDALRVSCTHRLHMHDNTLTLYIPRTIQDFHAHLYVLWAIQDFYVSIVFKHDICQNFYATDVLKSKNLRKKRVNHDNSEFATKQRKCLDLSTIYIFLVKLTKLLMRSLEQLKLLPSLGLVLTSIPVIEYRTRVRVNRVTWLTLQQLRHLRLPKEAALKNKM